MKTLVAFLSLCVLGCSSHYVKPRTQLLKDNILIITQTQEKTSEICEKLTGKYCRGCYVYGNLNRIYVPYSQHTGLDGEFLPDFEVLGHEIYHSKDLGGRFHK